jgi:hypothetical protein
LVESGDKNALWLFPSDACGAATEPPRARAHDSVGEEEFSPAVITRMWRSRELHQ